MVAAPAVPVHWLVEVVNEYGHRPRAEAGESAHPYPALTQGRPPQAARLTEAELTALADRLWPVFGAPDPAARVTALNSLLSAAKLTPEIDGHGDQAALRDAGHGHGLERRLRRRLGHEQLAGLTERPAGERCELLGRSLHRAG